MRRSRWTATPTTTIATPIATIPFRTLLTGRIVTVGLASYDRVRDNPVVTDRPLRAPRADTREVAELKQIKASQPELAAAVDMQLALVEMQRRVQGRVPLPWIQVDPAALRRGARTARRAHRLVARSLPVLWMGTGFRGDHAERRPPAHLRPLRRAVGVRAADLSVLRERRPRAHHVVRDARRPLPCVRVRRLPPLSQSVRRAQRHASGDGGCGFNRDAAAGCRGDAARICRVVEPRNPRKHETTKKKPF